MGGGAGHHVNGESLIGAVNTNVPSPSPLKMDKATISHKEEPPAPNSIHSGAEGEGEEAATAPSPANSKRQRGAMSNSGGAVESVTTKSPRLARRQYGRNASS